MLSKLSKPLVWAVIVFCLSFYINTRNNNYPHWYTWDEGSKGEQVINNSRNFNHPLLCVNSAAALYKITSPGDTMQDAVQAGRVMSAFFMALGAASLVWLAWKTAGACAGLIAAIFIILHKGFVVAAVHFKEDASLLGCWAVLLALLYLYQQKPSLHRAVWAGLGAAACMSAKYVGVFPAILGIWFIVSAGKSENRNRTLKLIAAYLLPAVIGWLIINYQMLTNFDVVFAKLDNEITHQLNNDTGVSSPLVILADQSGWAGLFGFVVYVFMRLRSYRTWPRIELFALGTGLAYLASQFFIKRVVGRYLLPVWMIEWWLTAIGAGLIWMWAREQQQYSKKLMLCGLSILVAAISGYGLVESGVRRLKAYGEPDSRLAMAKYIDEKLSPDDYIAYDLMVALANPYAGHVMPDGFAPRQRMYKMVHWPDTFDPDILKVMKDLGMTHVVTMPHYVDRYFEISPDTDFGQFRDVKYRRPFYTILRESAEIVWEEPAGADEFLSPFLRLYKLP